MREIKDVVDNYKGKISHFLIELPDNQIHLKCDNYDDKSAWIKAINFMRDRFQSSLYFNQRRYKEKLDDETSLRIIAENEWKNWDDIQVDSNGRTRWTTSPSSRTRG